MASVKGTKACPKGPVPPLMRMDLLASMGSIFFVEGCVGNFKELVVTTCLDDTALDQAIKNVAAW